MFPTIEYAERVSHFDSHSDYRDFTGFYVLFWVALTIMAVTTILRNLKDTGRLFRVEIWQLFTVKTWELAVADALMVISTALVLPLHRLYRSAVGERLGMRWAKGGIAVQSIFQFAWLAIWVA